jgi:phage gpG-like protein
MIQIQLQNSEAVIDGLSNITSPSVVRRVVYAMAQQYHADILNYVYAGRAYRQRTGQLTQSIGWHGNNDTSATVYANAEYAPFIEFGTQPHSIVPVNRKMLRFPVVGGGMAFARRVNHPGSRAYPFFYTDQATRRENMQARAIEILNEAING